MTDTEKSKVDIDSPDLMLMGCDAEEIAHGISIISDLFQKYISLYQEKAPSEDNIIPAQDLQQLNSANAPRQQHICPQHQGSGNELLPIEDTGSLLPTIPPLCQLK